MYSKSRDYKKVEQLRRDWSAGCHELAEAAAAERAELAERIASLYVAARESGMPPDAAHESVAQQVGILSSRLTNPAYEADDGSAESLAMIKSGDY